MLNTYSFSRISILTPQGLAKQSSLKISRDKISEVGGKGKYDLEAAGELYLYPALINVHDHMRGNYLPKVGPGPESFYLNWVKWIDDLNASEVLKEREKNSVEDLYLLSAYKNLFSGVVTVNDHFPHKINDPFIPLMPLRVIKDYTLAHTCTSFGQRWGDSIEEEFSRAVSRNLPFIIHCEEGFDKATQEGLDRLLELQCLDEHNVLIHCIGFSDRDIEMTRQSGATVVWCPTSNMFMFNVTCKIRKMLKAGINVCIGTDATHSGAINLFAEMKYAKQLYKHMYGSPLADRKIFEMVTSNPARAFRMQDKIGTIEQGKLADLLLIRPDHKDPYTAFVNMDFENIELLIYAGNPILGAARYEDLFIRREVDYTKVSIRNREMLVKGDPAGLMKRIRKAVNYKKQLDFIPIDEYSYS